MSDDLLALTLWPEWAFALAHLGKDSENRGWAPPASIIGKRIAIHAGRHIGGRPGLPARNEGFRAVALALRACGGVERDVTRWWLQQPPTSAIVCTAVVTGWDRDDRTGWDVPGQCHWRLADVQVLPEPVPCRGAQGLWRVPADIAARVLAQEEVPHVG